MHIMYIAKNGGITYTRAMLDITTMAKPDAATITIRIPRVLLERVQRAAERDMRSANQEILYLLTEALPAHEREPQQAS